MRATAVCAHHSDSVLWGRSHGSCCWYSEERLLQTASLSPTLDTPDINITGYSFCFPQDLSPCCRSSHCGRKSGGFLWRSGDLQDEEVKADALKGVSAAARHFNLLMLYRRHTGSLMSQHHWDHHHVTTNKVYSTEMLSFVCVSLTKDQE